MLSSKDGMFDKVRGALAGCNGYLVKPLEARRLREVLDKHFERPSRIPDSEFADSRAPADSSQPDSQFLPGRPPVARPPTHGTTNAAPPAMPVKSGKPVTLATAASPRPARAASQARKAIDNENLLEPYRAEISTAFAATVPASLEDRPDYKPSSNGRGG